MLVTTYISCAAHFDPERLEIWTATRFGPCIRKVFVSCLLILRFEKVCTSPVVTAAMATFSRLCVSLDTLNGGDEIEE